MSNRSPSRIQASFAFLLFIAVGVTAIPVQAQLPGQRIPSRERIRSEFLDNILEGVNEVRRDWTESVRDDEVGRLMDLYSPDAVLIPPDGVPRRGTDAIREFWAGALPAMGSVETGLSDVDASGQMAMVVGSYLMYRLDEEGDSRRYSGGILTVYLQTGRSWHIRSQVFGNPGGG